MPTSLSDYDIDGDVCECGCPIATHPPLKKPKPLSSWMAQRNRNEALAENAAIGKMVSYWNGHGNSINQRKPDAE